MEQIKVLAIGNSFSQDGTRYLQALDGDLFVRNLYIGGCSFDMHYDNLINDRKAYRYEENASPIQEELVSIKDGLLRDDWDIITVQQVSGKSGQLETYEPYMTELLNYVKSFCPNAKIYFHQTWAYDEGSDHPDFPAYGNDSNKMDECIKYASETAAKNHGLPMIRTGEFIHWLRNEHTLGDTPLYRDKFHLSMTEGRYAAALAWDYYLTGKVSEVIPEQINKDLAQKIIAEFKKHI